MPIINFGISYSKYKKLFTKTFTIISQVQTFAHDLGKGLDNIIIEVFNYTGSDKIPIEPLSYNEIDKNNVEVNLGFDPASQTKVKITFTPKIP